MINRRGTSKGEERNKNDEVIEYKRRTGEIEKRNLGPRKQRRMCFEREERAKTRMKKNRQMESKSVIKEG